MPIAFLCTSPLPAMLRFQKYKIKKQTTMGYERKNDVYNVQCNSFCCCCLLKFKNTKKNHSYCILVLGTLIYRLYTNLHAVYPQNNA